MTNIDGAPVRRGGGSPAIYEALKRDILDLGLAPGDALDEMQLSERFGMSRTPVREALVRLVAEGLASTLPNRSTVVATIDFATLPDFLDALTLFYRVTTRLAARRRTQADLAHIAAAQQAFRAAAESGDAMAMLTTNRDFHLAVAEAGGNRYFRDPFARLLDEGMRILRLYYRAFDDRLPDRYVEEHDAIIAAIAAGDEETADRLAAVHAAQIVTQLQRFLDPAVGASLTLASLTTGKNR